MLEGFSRQNVFIPLIEVYFSPLWKGANKTSIVNQVLYSPGEGGGKDLFIIKKAACVIGGTASSIDIWVSATPIKFLVL